MKKRKNLLFSFLWRTGASIPLGLGGFHLIGTVFVSGTLSVYRLLAGIVAVMLPGVLMGPPVARFFGFVGGNIFYPDRGDAARPAYSVPRARRSQGQFHDALREYEKILENHPRDLQSYLDMMEIAGSDLGNASLANRIAGRALAVIRDPKDRHAIELWRLRANGR
jgi:hypothetical protein